MAKIPSKKRSAAPLNTAKTKTFKKDWERLNSTNRFDMNKLKEVMAELFKGNQLAPEYRDHELTGEWAGHRECHIGGDFLLIYQLTTDLITFVRAGTHAELFE